MNRKEALELLAWVWLVFSIIGGIVIASNEEYIIALAVVFQGAVFSVFLLVFSDLASTISMLDNRVKNLDESLQLIAKKYELPVRSTGKVKPIVNKEQEVNISEKDVKVNIQNYRVGYKDEEVVEMAIDEVLVSNISIVSLRSGPGNDYPFVGKIEKGMELSFLHRENEWIKVQTKEGLEGWMKDLYVYKI